MTKKTPSVLLLVLFIMACCSLKVNSEPETTEPEPVFQARKSNLPVTTLRRPKLPYPYWHLPYPFNPHPSPKPAPGPHSPKPHPDPKIKKCLKDLKEVHPCMPKLYVGWLTHDFSDLSGQCCDTFKKIDKDCVKTIFCRFTPFFESMVKEHCSKKKKDVVEGGF